MHMKKFQHHKSSWKYKLQTTISYQYATTRVANFFFNDNAKYSRGEGTVGTSHVADGILNGNITSEIS